MMEKESDAGDPVQKPYPPPPPPPMNQPYPPPQLDHQLRYYQPPPGSQFPHELHVSAWSTGICDCLTDIPLCCVTCLCPCITFGQIAEIVDRGSSTCETTGLLYSLIFFFTGAQFVYSCTYRSRLRLEYGISGDVVTDLCVHIFCETCALCQEYRELKHRGYDVPLGWHGNMARQGVQMAPMPPEGMTR